MKLLAKHIPALVKFARNRDISSILLEAYNQKDLEAVKHLQSFKETNADFYAGKFFVDCCGFSIVEFERTWNDLIHHWK